MALTVISFDDASVRADFAQAMRDAGLDEGALIPTPVLGPVRRPSPDAYTNTARGCAVFKQDSIRACVANLREAVLVQGAVARGAGPRPSGRAIKIGAVQVVLAREPLNFYTTTATWAFADALALAEPMPTMPQYTPVTTVDSLATLAPEPVKPSTLGLGPVPPSPLAQGPVPRVLADGAAERSPNPWAEIFGAARATGAQALRYAKDDCAHEAFVAEMARAGIEMGESGAGVMEVFSRVASGRGATLHESLVECVRELKRACKDKPVEFGRVMTRAYLCDGIQKYETSAAWRAARVVLREAMPLAQGPVLYEGAFVPTYLDKALLSEDMHVLQKISNWPLAASATTDALVRECVRAATGDGVASLDADASYALKQAALDALCVAACVQPGRTVCVESASSAERSRAISRVGVLLERFRATRHVDGMPCRDYEIVSVAHARSIYTIEIKFKSGRVNDLKFVLTHDMFRRAHEFLVCAEVARLDAWYPSEYGPKLAAMLDVPEPEPEPVPTLVQEQAPEPAAPQKAYEFGMGADLQVLDTMHAASDEVRALFMSETGGLARSDLTAENCSLIVCREAMTLRGAITACAEAVSARAAAEHDGQRLECGPVYVLKQRHTGVYVLRATCRFGEWPRVQTPLGAVSCGPWRSDGFPLANSVRIVTKDGAEPKTSAAAAAETKVADTVSALPGPVSWSAAYSCGAGLFALEIDAVSVLAPGALASLHARIDQLLAPWRTGRAVCVDPIQRLYAAARLIASEFAQAHGDAFTPLGAGHEEGASFDSDKMPRTLRLVLRAGSASASLRAYTHLDAATLADSFSASIARPSEYARALVLGANATSNDEFCSSSVHGNGASPHVAALECKRALLAQKIPAECFLAGATRLSAVQQGDTLVWHVVQMYKREKTASERLHKELSLRAVNVLSDAEFVDGDLVRSVSGRAAYTRADNERIVREIRDSAGGHSVRVRVTELSTSTDGRWRVEWQYAN